MPSSHRILCRPLLLLPPIPPSIRVFSNESTLRSQEWVGPGHHLLKCPPLRYRPALGPKLSPPGERLPDSWSALGRFPVHQAQGSSTCSLLSRYPLTSLEWHLPAKLLQSCLTLCNPMDCSPPGSSVQGILQARIPERIAMSFS